MKISPMSSSGLTIGAISTGADAPQTMAQKVRALKMNTNATPGKIEEEIPPAELPISNPPNSSDPTQAAVGDSQPLSPQLAALARAKRALQVKEREIADREKALLERSSNQAGAIDRARLKSDPLGVLQEAEVTYDQLTEAILAQQNGGYNPKVKELEEKLAALEAGFDKKLADRETQAEQQALAEMRREATQIMAQGDDFELVRETGGINHVMDLIERTYRKSGEVLDIREALKLVEAELVNDYSKLANLKKLQSQLAPQPVLQPPPQQQRQMRTLTNRDTAAAPLSKRARALAAFAGTLKK